MVQAVSPLPAMPTQFPPTAIDPMPTQNLLDAHFGPAEVRESSVEVTGKERYGNGLDVPAIDALDYRVYENKFKKVPFSRDDVSRAKAYATDKGSGWD